MNIYTDVELKSLTQEQLIEYINKLHKHIDILENECDNLERELDLMDNGPTINKFYGDDQ